MFVLVCSSIITTTLAAGTTSKCVDPGCAYGQIFDITKCACACEAANGFSGTLCDKVDCSIATDAAECALGLFTCASPSDFTSCPQLCQLCPYGGTTIPATTTKPAPVTTTVTNAPTTTVTQAPTTTAAGGVTATTTLTASVTQCTNPGCAYGQIFDTVKCQCNCDTANGFSGTLCDKVDCAIATDAAECALGIFTCADPAEFTSCPRYCGLCPLV